MHFYMRSEVYQSHDFAQLMLSLKHREFLLLVQWNFIIVVSSQPRMCQSGCCVVPLRWRVGAKVKEEVLGQGREVGRELPLNRLRLDVLQLLVVVDLARGVARVLPARQKLIYDYTAGPQVHLFRVALACDLLWRHINRCTSSFAVV